MAAVRRSSGAWSDGGRNRRPGRGANSARRFGGSLSVILMIKVDGAELGMQLSELWLMNDRGETFEAVALQSNFGREISST